LPFKQGILTKGKGSVRLISSLELLILWKVSNVFNVKCSWS
jgi:hypothetical protein